MAKTRSSPVESVNSSEKMKELVAASFILEEKTSKNNLYSSQTIDYMTNNIAAGNDNAAWYFWSRLPELRYVSRYISNALSVSTLYAGKSHLRGEAPERLPDSHPASQLLRDFAGGPIGHSDLLDRLGLHLTITGDSVLIGPRNGSDSLEAPFDVWKVHSTQEVYSRNGKVFLRMPGNILELQIPDGAIAIRIWRPHPKIYWEADSPVKGSFQVLKELDMLNQHIIASGSSRLSGSGLLLIPEEFDLPGAETETDGTEVDQFVALLIEVMGMAKKNPESAAARIPVMVRGPGDFIDKWKHMDFSTAFDNMVPELRMGSLRRLALGMDVPPEVLLGSADSNSWSAWQSDESTLRLHLIPLLQLICSSLTTGWLRPALENLPLTDAQKEEIPDIVLHFDVSNLKIRQDISGDAQSLYDRYGIDADALRLAIGYSSNDAPDDKELARQILLSLVATGQPELVLYALGGLRDNFGVKDLPKPPAPPDAAPPGNQPGQVVAPKETSPVKGVVPGERSQAKQTSPPPIPKVGGDPGNNAVK